MIARRQFIKDVLIGAAGILTGAFLLNKANANVPMARLRGLPLQKLNVSGEPPITWTVLDCRRNCRITYAFHKGPDYTTLEDAIPYMQEYVHDPGELNIVFCTDKSVSDCIRMNEDNRVVMLVSVTYSGTGKV
jgi:hypothetical protein